MRFSEKQINFTFIIIAAICIVAFSLNFLKNQNQQQIADANANIQKCQKGTHKGYLTVSEVQRVSYYADQKTYSIDFKKGIIHENNFPNCFVFIDPYITDTNTQDSLTKGVNVMKVDYTYIAKTVGKPLKSADGPETIMVSYLVK